MNQFIHSDNVLVSLGNKRSKLLFNIIKTIIISFTYANPGRMERAFQSNENKTVTES